MDGCIGPGAQQSLPRISILATFCVFYVFPSFSLVDPNFYSFQSVKIFQQSLTVILRQPPTAPPGAARPVGPPTSPPCARDPGVWCVTALGVAAHPPRRPASAVGPVQGAHDAHGAGGGGDRARLADDATPPCGRRRRVPLAAAPSRPAHAPPPPPAAGSLAWCFPPRGAPPPVALPFLQRAPLLRLLRRRRPGALAAASSVFNPRT